MRLRVVVVIVLGCCIPVAGNFAQAPSAAPTQNSAMRPGVMTAAEVAKILPATVFFRGLSAPVQLRNSGGVRFDDGRMMLAALVDTSGYSTQVKEKYQAYFITESALMVGAHPLPPGAYGCGFIADDVFVVQDVGGHDLFTVPSTRDAELRRPTPLQVTSAGRTGAYRLYTGRSYISLTLAGSR